MGQVVGRETLHHEGGRDGSVHFVGQEHQLRRVHRRPLSIGAQGHGVGNTVAGADAIHLGTHFKHRPAPSTPGVKGTGTG